MGEKKKLFLKGYPIQFFLILAVSVSFPAEKVQGANAEKLIPVGKTVGITMDTEGLLVLGTGSVSGDETVMPGKALQAGDRILQVNGRMVENKEMFQQMIENGEGKPMNLLLDRNGLRKQVVITPAFSRADHAYKIGVWIRDSLQGIGTVTFYDPETETFGALGHGVYDLDTGALLQMRGGTLTETELTEIRKGKNGTAGELIGKVELQEKLACVNHNRETGIFGYADGSVFAGQTLSAAEPEEIRKGSAVILSDLEGDGKKEYEIVIEEIRKNGGKDHKDMIIRITDDKLLRLTGGIVQGMSGSPIIQDGKLVGAVTHVLVNDPTRGYGIFIENMLEAAG